MKNDDRNFGFFFSAIILIFSIYLFSNDYYFIFFIIISIILIFLSILKPTYLKKPKNWWINLGVVLSKFTTPIVLTLIYSSTILPIALIFKLMNKDALDINFKVKKQSYWKSPEDENKMEDQF